MADRHAEHAAQQHGDGAAVCHHQHALARRVGGQPLPGGVDTGAEIGSRFALRRRMAHRILPELRQCGAVAGPHLG
jgi:hypothetical protein